MMYGYEDLTPRHRYDVILDNLDAMYDELKEEIQLAEDRADRAEAKVDYHLQENQILATALQNQQQYTDTAYSQRAIAAVAFAHTVLLMGGTAGVGQDDREDQAEEWRVVLYIDTPAGQLSWHIAPADQPMLAGLPEYKGKWSGSSNSSNTEFYKSFIV